MADAAISYSETGVMMVSLLQIVSSFNKIIHWTRLTHFKMLPVTHIAAVIDEGLWRNVKYNTGNFYHPLFSGLLREIFSWISICSGQYMSFCHSRQLFLWQQYTLSRIYCWWITDWRTRTDFIYYIHSGNISTEDCVLSSFTKCYALQ